MANKLIGQKLAVEEYPDSPTWLFEDVASCTRKLRGPYLVAKEYFRTKCYKGYVGVAADGEVAGWIVKRAQLSRAGDGFANITVEYVGKPEQPPPTEYEIRGDRTDRPLEQHPVFRGNFEERVDGEWVISDVGELRLAAIRELLTKQTTKERLEAKVGSTETLAANYVLTKTATEYTEASNAVYSRQKRGMTHFAIYTPKIVITSYHANYPAPLSIGGYREIPPVNGGVILPIGTEWLREADAVKSNGTWWVLTKSWIGAPEWDHAVYPSV